MLPVINIDPLIYRSTGFASVAAEIRQACVEHGFFYISGHGIPGQLLDELEDVARQFFALSVDEKMRIRMELGGRAWRGYFPVGDELTSGKPDLKEGLYFGEELDATHARVANGTPLHGANLFSDTVPTMRRIVLDYMDAMTELGHHIMRGIALSLGLEQEHLRTVLTYDPITLFRIFHYPPQEVKDQDTWGVGEHTDYGLLTILLQDKVGGLQVKSKSGWIEAPFIPGTFVCNIGDMLDRLTRGFYRSTPHRVVNRSGVGRLSFPFFFDPSWDASVSPLDLPFDADIEDDTEERWDHADVHQVSGTYGEYLIEKVGKVFPDLGSSAL